MTDDNSQDNVAPESLEVETESCEASCAPVPSAIKLGLVGIAVVLFVFNSLVYVSPAFAKQVGKLVPDSFAPKQSHARPRFFEQD